MILTESLSKLAAYFKSLHITDDQIHQVTLYITGMLSGFLKKMFASGTGMVTNVATFCLNLFATLILTFYFLKDKEIIFDVLDNCLMPYLLELHQPSSFSLSVIPLPYSSVLSQES